MANRKKRLNNKEEEEFVPLDELFLALSKRIDKVPVGQGKTAAIKWSVIAAVLIAVSSVLFLFNWMGSWIPAIIGAPAGVILYVIGLGLVQRTSLGEHPIFQMRQDYSFNQRLKRIAIWFAVFILIFVPVGKYIPYGLGGALLIVLVMTALTVARRTPQELLWAKEGVPDPRDLEDADSKDDYAEEEESAEDANTSTEADTIYYDEKRGGFGGKLK